jgi:hypothetical protein
MPVLPCVIDVEASGFGRGSFPIEVGYVRGDGSAYCSLVRPEPDWLMWDGRAEHLHGLTRELLHAHGRPVTEIAAQLNDGLAGADVYCDGWAHDYTWLAVLFDAAGRRPLFRLRHIHDLLGPDALARWDPTCTAVRAAHPVRRHRASHDARVLQRALALLLETGESLP